MTGRTLGETIEIDSDVGDDPWHALADPGQVEAALLDKPFRKADLARKVREVLRGDP